MSAIGDRIIERLARIPMNGIALRMEIGCDPAELDGELRGLEESGQIRRLNGKYHITPPAPIAAAAEVPVSKAIQEKVCTGPCGESKPLDQFYDRQNQCKRCVLDRQKALKLARAGGAAPRKKGGGSARPKRLGRGLQKSRPILPQYFPRPSSPSFTRLAACAWARWSNPLAA
jgi:hypothetical protein